MQLKFSGGVWNGLELSADVAPQFIDLHGIMNRSQDDAPYAETVLLTDAKKFRYELKDASDDGENVEYQFCE